MAVEPSGKKVVLVWNEHPTEVVAGHHARKVAEILRRDYGHEVVMEKIPVRKTDYGILMRESAANAREKLKKLDYSSTIAARYARKHKAFAFNFHASKAEAMGQSETMAPHDFRVGEQRIHYKIRRLDTEIVFLPNRGKSFVIEMPGIYFDLRSRIHDKTIDKLFEIEPGDTNRFFELLLTKIGAMQLKHPEQQKYLRPAISEKIAAAIHERISRK